MREDLEEAIEAACTAVVEPNGRRKRPMGALTMRSYLLKFLRNLPDESMSVRELREELDG